jgi:hypothetical protein
VYFPIRALGFELGAYAQILQNDSGLILFFTQITILIAFISVLVSFFVTYLSRFLRVPEYVSLVLWHRFIALVCSVAFIFTSQRVLNPTSQIQLYFWSGAHYFIISFFQVLIRSELSMYKTNPKITIGQANNYFGVSLNLFGMLSIFVFSFFYERGKIVQYTQYALFLEVAFVCYLLIVRRYWQDLFIVISQLGLLRVFCCSAAIFFALLLAGCFAMIIMKMGILAPLVTMGLISGVYSCYKTVLKQSDLMWLFNVAIGYGLLLMVLTSSVLTYFLHQNQ